MRRRIAAGMLALLLFLSLGLTACGKEAEEDASANEKAEPKPVETETAAADTEEEAFAFESVDWYNPLDQDRYPDWGTYVWPELQRFFLEKLNVAVEYHGFDTKDYGAKFKSALASGAEIDLMGMSEGTTGFYIWYERSALQPLDDLLAEYAPELLADMPDYAFRSCTVSGHIYGMPTIKDLAVDIGFFFNETMLDALGETERFLDIPFENAKDFDGFFHRVCAERNEQLPELAEYPLVEHYSTREAYIKCDSIVNGLIMAKIEGIGSLEDYADEGAVMLYETPDYRSMAGMIKNWVDDGINAYNAKEYEHETIRRDGKELGYWTYGSMTANYGQYAEYGWHVMLRHPEYSFTFTGYPLAAFTAINARTENTKKAAAMRVYNLMAEEPYVITTMHCGVEGIHWVRHNDAAGNIRADFGFEGSRNSDPAAYGYKQWYFYTTGNLTRIWLPYDEDDDFLNIMNEVNESALTSKYMGFLYATTDTENEIAACAEVVEEYNEDLMYGMADDVDSRIDEFIEALYANGVQAVTDDVNAQMAKWLR